MRAVGPTAQGPPHASPAPATLTGLCGEEEEEEEEGSGGAAPAAGGHGPGARQPAHGFASASAGSAGARCPPGAYVGHQPSQPSQPAPPHRLVETGTGRYQGNHFQPSAIPPDPGPQLCTQGGVTGCPGEPRHTVGTSPRATCSRCHWSLLCRCPTCGCSPLCCRGLCIQGTARHSRPAPPAHGYSWRQQPITMASALSAGAACPFPSLCSQEAACAGRVPRAGLRWPLAHPDSSWGVHNGARVAFAPLWPQCHMAGPIRLRPGAGVVWVPPPHSRRWAPSMQERFLAQPKQAG